MGYGSYIPFVFPDQPCHICGSKENVKSKQVPITSCAMTHEVKTGMYVQSNVCKKCELEGWKLLGKTAFWGDLTYCNLRGKIQFKNV